jgi:hypothetical protein
VADVAPVGADGDERHQADRDHDGEDLPQLLSLTPGEGHDQTEKYFL